MTPFSLGILLELLFGELGPEPGALLHAESEPHKSNTYLRNTKSQSKIERSEHCGSPTCHIEGAFLSGSDGAVSATKQRTAPPLAHLLLQPGAELQVGFRGWKEDRRTRVNTTSLVIYSPSVMEFPNRPKIKIYSWTLNISNVFYVNSLLELIFNNVLHLVFEKKLQKSLVHEHCCIPNFNQHKYQQHLIWVYFFPTPPNG